MEQRLSIVTLGVRDVARSRRFYEELGWRASGAGDGSIVFFQAGGIALALYGREALAADAGLSDEGGGFGGIVLAHNVRSRDEADALLVQAEAAGGRILKPAEDAFWGGYSGCFADPDGHVWEVAWNPHFALTPEGDVRLPA